MEDLELISINAAIIDRNIVSLFYSDIGGRGQGDNKKAMADSYAKHMEAISNIDGPQRYHGYSIIDEKRHLLITTQPASLKRDETSRRRARARVAEGEKPDPNMYLCLAELYVEKCQESSDTQEFTRVVAVGKTWCVQCPAGGGKCVHKGMSLRDQIRLWSPNYGGDHVQTDATKLWKHRGSDKMRSFRVTEPINQLSFEKLVEGKICKYRLCHVPSNQVHTNCLLTKATKSSSTKNVVQQSCSLLMMLKNLRDQTSDRAAPHFYTRTMSMTKGLLMLGSK